MGSPDSEAGRDYGAVRRLIGRTARARGEWIELPVPAVSDTLDDRRLDSSAASEHSPACHCTAPETIVPSNSQ